MAPSPVPPFITAIYNPCKDVFLYLKGQRRDIKDLEDRISELIIKLRSINSRKERIDRLVRNSVFTEHSEEYIVMKADIAVMHKKYTKFIGKYTKMTSNQLSSTAELNLSTVCLMIDKLGDLKSKIVTFYFLKLGRLSRDIVKLSTRASEALDRLKPENMIQKKSEPIQEKWNDSNVLSVFNTYVGVILEYLCEEGNKVGVFGPIGVGKTTVMKKLHSRLNEQKSLSGDGNSSHQLDKIIWIEYPLEPETEDKIVEKLQNEIMEQLSIDHEAKKSIHMNATIISAFLQDKKYIVLMDQVSKYIDLNELGLRHVSKKVVIASSERNVVRRMTEHEVEIQGLEKDDGWILFENSCGKLYDSRKIEIADRIIELCAGIAWTIHHVAKHLKDKQDDASWNDARRILESESKYLNLIDLEGIDKGYEIMYKELAIDTKKCLLYGALFPDQYKLITDNLIECWIAEGFMDGTADQKVRLSRERGQTILNHLIDKHMLQWCCGKKYIKMTPNFRRLALELDNPDGKNCVIWVPSKDRKPNEITWTTVTRMSLIGCKSELPKSPKCCNIYTLLLQLKPNLQKLEDKFFDHMKSLHVLDLNHTDIGALPTSISKLENLKSLYLNDCQNLVALPSEADKLKNLEFLNICGTSISSLPKEIKCMVDLRCLRASFPVKRHNHNSKGKEVEDLEPIIPSDIINKLSKLEELSIDTAFEFAVAERLAEEMATLEYLTTLCFNFPNVSSVNTFVNQSRSFKNKDTSWGTLTFRSFKIFIGGHETRRTYESDFSGILAERWLRYSTDEQFSSACKELLKQASAFEIIGHDGVESLTCSQFDLHSVKVCVVERCNKLKSIVDGYITSEKQGIAKQSLLQNLEKLYLHDLQLLECIWDGPVPSHQSLTNLTAITINGCPKLTKILDPALGRTLQSLQYLKVENCSEISEIIKVNGQEGRGGTSEIAEVHEGSSNSEQGDLSDILKSLRKIELSDLPVLQSICNSTSINWNSLTSIIVKRCSKLCNLSLTPTNAKKLALIQGEESWWEKLSFPPELRRSLPFHPFTEESSDTGAQPRGEASTSARSEFNPEEEITSSNNNTSINSPAPSNTVNVDNGAQSLKEETTISDKSDADWEKFVNSKEQRNVGIGYGVHYNFFVNITLSAMDLTDAHIDAYLAVLHSNPEFADVHQRHADMVLTSTGFMVEIREIFKRYHSLENPIMLDESIEEIISDDDLKHLSEYVSGHLPGWRPFKPWYNYNKLIFVAHLPGHWVTICVDFEEHFVKIWDSKHHIWNEHITESRRQFFIPLMRIFPQILKYCRFWNARPDLTPKYTQWNWEVPELNPYKQNDSVSCGVYALRYVEQLLSTEMVPLATAEDLVRFRKRLADVLFKFSTDESTLV